MLLLIFFSCKKDDTNNIDIPIKDLSEQYIVENDSIIQFMKTHFFNYSDFSNISSTDSPEIIFDSIIGDNLNKTPIYDQVSTLQISVKDANDNDVNHNLYYHIIREGIGDNPTVADSVFVGRVRVPVLLCVFCFCVFCCWWCILLSIIIY